VYFSHKRDGSVRDIPFERTTCLLIRLCCTVSLILVTSSGGRFESWVPSTRARTSLNHYNRGEEHEGVGWPVESGNKRGSLDAVGKWKRTLMSQCVAAVWRSRDPPPSSSSKSNASRRPLLLFYTELKRTRSKKCCTFDELEIVYVGVGVAPFLKEFRHVARQGEPTNCKRPYAGEFERGSCRGDGEDTALRFSLQHPINRA